MQKANLTIGFLHGGAFVAPDIFRCALSIKSIQGNSVIGREWPVLTRADTSKHP
jgi:hypothetical protein